MYGKIRSPRSKHKSGSAEDLSPRTTSPRTTSPRTTSPRAVSPRAKPKLVAAKDGSKQNLIYDKDDDDDDDGDEMEIHTHGAYANQLSAMFHLNALSTPANIDPGGTGGGGANGTSRSPTSGDSDVDYVDEYNFVIKPHAVEAYKNYRLATAGAADTKMQRYRAVIAPAINGHLDSDAIDLITLGIPMQARRRMWLAASGASVRMLTRRRYYRTLCRRLKDVGFEDKTMLREIDQDVGRTLGAHEIADSSAYLKRLRHVLQLYCLHNHDEGFTQGLTFFVASLMVQGMSNEECFWMLDIITNDFFPMSFDVNCTGQTVDRHAFQYYAAKMFPKFVDLLEKNELNLEMLCTYELFGSLLCNKMPYESVFVVWDRMMFGGAAAFFEAVFKIVAVIEREVNLLAEKNLETIKTKATETISGIVDMPKLLARKLHFEKPVDWRCLHLRRMKMREHTARHPPENSKKIVAHGSASSSSSGDKTITDTVEPKKPTPVVAVSSSSTQTNSPKIGTKKSSEKISASASAKKKDKSNNEKSAKKMEELRNSPSESSDNESIDDVAHDAAILKKQVSKLNFANVAADDTGDLPLTPSMNRGGSFNRRKRANSTVHSVAQNSSNSTTHVSTAAPPLPPSASANSATVSMTISSDEESIEEKEKKK